MLIVDPDTQSLAEIVSDLAKFGVTSIYNKTNPTLSRMQQLRDQRVVRYEFPFDIFLTRSGREKIKRGVEVVVGGRAEHCRFDYQEQKAIKY